MKAIRAIVITGLCVLATGGARSQQYTLEFSVVGSGGGETQIGQDTLFQTLGQPLVGDTPPDSNTSGGFLNLVSGGPVGLTYGVYQISDKWNMVSVPFIVSDYHKSVLYPTAISNAFAYQGSYATQAVLENAAGYWLKFSGNQTVALIGAPRYTDSINVATGWNMIGALSVSVPTSSIVSVPSGITTSNFFEYNGTYKIASTVDPGRAYWVKTQQPGTLYLSSGTTIPHAGPISISANEETPPPAPGMEAGIPASTPLPSEFALAQNFPNPFNPVTLIRYDLPWTSAVQLTVYNMIGQEVGSLVDGLVDAGSHSVHWDASLLGSGVYFYRLRATSLDGSKHYEERRKMLVIK